MQSKIAGERIYRPTIARVEGAASGAGFSTNTADFHAAACGVLAMSIDYSVAPGLLARHGADRHQAGGNLLILGNHLGKHRRLPVDQIIRKQHREGFITDQMPRTLNGMSQPSGLFLADKTETNAIGCQLPQHFQ